MKPRPAALMLLAAAAGALTFTQSGCSLSGAQPTTVEAAQPPEVEVVTVRSARAAAVMEMPGAVAPVRSVTLTAPVGGLIRTLAEEGARVPAGAVAAALDAPGLPEAVSAARASVDAAERRQSGAMTAVSQAERERETSIATLEKTLTAAAAERDRRKSVLAETELQAQTEPVKLRAQLLAAEARLRQLRSGEREQRIRQLEAGLKVAQAETRAAERQLRRQRDLYVRGYISKSELEIAELNLERSNANVLTHKEELQLSREGAHPEAIQESEQQVEVARQAVRAGEGLAELVAQRKAELAAAEAEAEKAAGNLEAARSNGLPITRADQEAHAMAAEARRSRSEYAEARERLAQAAVRAPFAGQVVRRRARPGETVAPGAALLELVDPSRLCFEATAADTDLFRLRRGDQVEVRVYASSRPPLRGRVTEVILAAEPLKQAHNVKVQLDSASGLRAGMPGTARLRLAEVARTGLPVASLWRHFPREGRAEVLSVEEGRLVARKVRLGSQEGEEVEVRSGLADGDQVVVSGTSGLAPGSAVRVREARRVPSGR